MGMIEYFKLAINRYSDFEGRSRRSEYWYFVLAQFVLSLGVGIVIGLVGAMSNSLAMLSLAVYVIASLALIVPGIAVAIRRMHDLGYSGWMLLIGLIPFLGGFVLLYFMCTEGEPGANKWGPNPKAVAQPADIIDHMV